jgi:hypothetical protein
VSRNDQRDKKGGNKLNGGWSRGAMEAGAQRPSRTALDHPVMVPNNADESGPLHVLASATWKV